MKIQQATSLYPKQDEEAFVSLAQEFMAHIRDLTPRKKLEAKLNAEYEPESKYYNTVSIVVITSSNCTNQSASLRSWHYEVFKM